MCEARWWWLGWGRKGEGGREGGRHKSTQKGVGLRRRRRWRRSVQPWINKRWDRLCTCLNPTWATKSRCAFTSSTIAAEVIYANAFYLQSQWLIHRDATLDKMNGHRGRRRARGRRDERGGGAAVADKEKEEKKTLLLMTLSEKKHFEQKKLPGQENRQDGTFGNKLQRQKQVILFLKQHVYNSRECNDQGI